MDFALTDDQIMMQDQLGRALAATSALERVRRHAEDRSFPQDIWLTLCEFGIPGVLVEDRFGGLGLGVLDAALIAEQLGRHVVPAPYLGAVIAAPLAIRMSGNEPLQSDLLPRIAAGELRVALGLSGLLGGARGNERITSANGTLSGEATFVAEVTGADMVIVADEARRLHLVPMDGTGVSVVYLETVDRTRSTAAVTLDETPSIPLADDGGATASVVAQALWTVLAADLLGAATHMTDTAVAYAKTRVQFGKPIGSFQAVKHLCADMVAELEPGRALMWYAGHAVDQQLPDARLSAIHAKAYLAEAARRAARSAIEIHGGIGITDELGLHYWFKRISWDSEAFGGRTWLRELAAREQDLGRQASAA